MPKGLNKLKNKIISESACHSLLSSGKLLSISYSFEYATPLYSLYQASPKNLKSNFRELPHIAQLYNFFVFFVFVISYNYNIDYTRWSPYSACNATCGNGTKSRFRVCIDDDPAICTYNQKYFEYEDCNEGDCPGLLHARKKMKCLVRIK